MSLGLKLLTQAPSKEAVGVLFDQCFRHRLDIPGAMLDDFASSAGLSSDQMQELAASVASLIKRALYYSPLKSEADYLALFVSKSTDATPKPSLNKKIVALCAQILRSKLPLWRDVVSAQRVSHPKLVDVDWRVDITTSSEYISHTMVPTALFNLNILDQPRRVDEMPQVQGVAFEANKSTIDTVVDGLREIRDQLSKVKK